MPIPSSQGEPNHVTFSSTCPDEQEPRAQANWLHSSSQTDADTSRAQSTVAEAGAVASEGASGSGSEPMTDSRSSGAFGDGLSLETELAVEEAPSPPETMSPGMQLASDMTATPESQSMFLNNPPRDGDESRATDAHGDDIVGSAPTGTTAPQEGGAFVSDSISPPARRLRTSRPIRLRTTNFGVTPYAIREAEVWQPFGVAEALEQLGEEAGESSSPMSVMDTHVVNTPTPTAIDVDSEVVHRVVWNDNSAFYLGYDPLSYRMISSSPSSYLRPGSRFLGTQQSERQVYDVQVEIKHVDLRESFLCGYLRIQDLTEEHPTLTTYFEGEIIGPKYGFTTKHKSWGANERTDMLHWSKFAAFNKIAKQVKKGHNAVREHPQKDNIFMRWKEHFLVPDHRVRTIHGASFEGFYYICFSRVEGLVHGIYFHSKSEKFQQLELKHVDDRGCMNAIEFR